MTDIGPSGRAVSSLMYSVGMVPAACAGIDVDANGIADATTARAEISRCVLRPSTARRLSVV